MTTKLDEQQADHDRIQEDLVDQHFAYIEKQYRRKEKLQDRLDKALASQ